MRFFLWLLLFTFPLTAATEKAFTAYIHASKEGPNLIGKITIDDRSTGITQATWVYVKRALDYYKEHPPLFIILELNTPGGEVLAAERISDALKELDTQWGIPVVAVIDKWALSAGVMLAYSCRFITAANDASMGAAEPVIQDASGEMKVASEKVNSALRSDFANQARFFGRNPLIAEAMVDKDILLVMRDSVLMKLDNESQLRPQDHIVSAKGKLLTLDAEQLIEYKVADLLLTRQKREPLTLQERATGRWPASKELLFEVPFFAHIPHAEVVSYQLDWKGQLLTFLSNPAVASALFLVMMVGFYLEMSTPGFGVGGTLAVTALFLLLLSSFSLEVVDTLEIILFIAGLALVLIDVFVLPTFGLLGIIGIVIGTVGLLGVLLPNVRTIHFDFDSHTFNAAGEAFFYRLTWFCAAFLASVAVMLFLGRYLVPRFSFLRRFILVGHEQEGFTSAPTLPPIGSKGITCTPLRPAGKIEIQGELWDALSTGRFLEKGESISVVGFDSGAVIVQRSD